MSTLEKKLDELIAHEDSVRPEDVTLEHIRQKRDQSPDTALDFSTRYGGYIRGSGKVLTVTQAREIVRAAYGFLARFVRRQPEA